MMKKFILLMLAFVSFQQMNAQQVKGDFTIQPKVGLNIVSWRGDSHQQNSYVRLCLGVEGQYAITNKIGISVGLMYSQQGNKSMLFVSPQSDDFELYPFKFKMDYFNIPILFNYYLFKGLAVKVGIQPGFKIYDNLSSSMTPKSFDLSIPVGLSYEYKNICLDARYNYGLIDNYDLTNYEKGYDQKNSVFQFTLGYKFKL